MINRPLLVSDFDGVIIDGINEYWTSSRQACINIFSRQSTPLKIPLIIPDSFKNLRPWVHNGWEMVLLAAESVRPESQLNKFGWEAFANNYKEECSHALDIWGFKSTELQDALDNVRRESISNDFTHWLQSHKPFNGVIKRFQKLQYEDIELAVLTTKSIEFTNHLLHSYNLKPDLVFGHEQGSKTKVLEKLSKTRILKGFIEDRRSTLEIVLKQPNLNFLPCYLASWGYLKTTDLVNLPIGIHLLTPETLETPLEEWP